MDGIIIAIIQPNLLHASFRHPVLVVVCFVLFFKTTFHNGLLVSRFSFSVVVTMRVIHGHMIYFLVSLYLIIFVSLWHCLLLLLHICCWHFYVKSLFKKAKRTY